MKRFTVLLILLCIVAFIHLIINVAPNRDAPGMTTLSFGFILLCSYLFSDFLRPTKLPRITSYLFAGLLFGPFMLSFLPQTAVDQLRFIDDLALNFIAIAAGGELCVSSISKRIKPIAYLTVFGSIIIFAGMTFTLLALKLSVFANFSFREMFVISMLIGIIAIARSPSSAIAVISETGAAGPFTDTSLSVTVITDVMIIPLFAVTAALGKLLISNSGDVDLQSILVLVLALSASILSGIFLGWLITLYFRYIGSEKVIFILAVVFSTKYFSELSAHFLHTFFHISFDLEPMVMCLAAGFAVRNFFKGGESLIHAIERASLPVYVLFFTLTGASLDLNSLKSTWHIALILVVLRFIFMTISSYLGGRLADDLPKFNKLYGINFITQAGVSFGLVKMLYQEFPTWGDKIATILIAMIIINQIIGPVLMKTSLSIAGETIKARRRNKTL